MASGVVAGALVSSGRTSKDAPWSAIGRSNSDTWRTERCTRSSSTTETSASAVSVGSLRTSNINNPDRTQRNSLSCRTGGLAASSREVAIVAAVWPGSRLQRRWTPSRAVADRRGLPEQLRPPPQRGAYFHTGPESLFADFGFVRDRKIAKWRWVMRREVRAISETSQFRGASVKEPSPESNRTPKSRLIRLIVVISSTSGRNWT